MPNESDKRPYTHSSSGVRVKAGFRLDGDTIIRFKVINELLKARGMNKKMSQSDIVDTAVERLERDIRAGRF